MKATRRLGRSGIEVSAIGVGTNRWGNAAGRDALAATFTAAVDAGLTFFDTAEIYQRGSSERLLGSIAAQDGRPAVLASKFAPLPTRLTTRRFLSALDASLDRMGRPSIDLYYLHFPYSPRGVGMWMRGMAEAVRSGKIRAVGVSNCSPSQMRRAADVLGEVDIPLAANQVQYSLTSRKPERNGVLEACRELDVALVAYRPLAGGDVGSREGVAAEIAAGHGATVSQVALRWLLQRDECVVPIPGSTKAGHVRENAGALDFELSASEIEALDGVEKRQAS